MTKNFTPINYLIEKYKNQKKSVSQPKEVEPIPYPPEIEIKEVKESTIEEEIKPFVSYKKETIELPPDLKTLGIQSTSTTTFPTYQTIKLPISDAKIVQGLHAPINSSLRWLATLAIYLLKQAHLALKTIHGKVVRVRIR